MEQSTRAQSPCPEPQVLEALAAGGDGPDAGPDAEAARRHVAECPACRAAVADIRANDKFLAGIHARRAPGGFPQGLGPDLVPADLVPGYQILEEIHRGGQGVVYKAIQSETRRKVAIKLLLRGRSAGARQRIRFEQEIALAASLRHPNIVAVHDAVHPRDGWLGYAMEYVSGRPLDDWVKGVGFRTVPTLDEKVRLFIKVCDAVQYAHRHGIIHRDLKPGNILVDGDGEPRLCDFGVAKIAAGQGPQTLTGEFVGTLAYAAPEQVSGSPDQIDTRTDVYGLGVVLYEAIVGRMPYAVDGPFSEAVRNIISAAPGRPHARGVRLGRDLETILLKALAKEPERRYQSALRLGEDLHRSRTGEAIEARRSSGWYVMRKAARRHRPAVIVAAGIFVLVAASAIRERVQAASLRVALSNASIERGRALTELGNIPEAQSLLWPELLDAPAGTARWDPGDGRLSRSRAWWALWELHAAHPCEATVRTSEPNEPVRVVQLIPAPEPDDLVLLVGADGAMSLRTLPDFALRAVAAAESGPNGAAAGVVSAAFTRHGQIVTVGRDHTLRRWDVATLQPRGAPVPLPLPDIRDQPPNVRFSADGERLVVRGPTTIYALDAGSGSIIEKHSYTPDDRSWGFAVSPDGVWLAYVERGGISRHRIGEPSFPLHIAYKYANTVRGLVFATGVAAETHSLLFCGGGTIFTFDPRGSGEIRSFAQLENVSNMPTMALSADGRWLAAAGEDRRLSIWDASGSTGEQVRGYWAAHDAAVSPLAFTRDGRALLSGHADGVVQRWDLSDLPRAASPESDRRGAFTPLVGHTDSVFGVAVHEEDGRLRGYSGSYDCTVRAWDLRTGREIARSDPLGPGPEAIGRVESMALSPDGRTVAATVEMGDYGDMVFLDAGTLHVIRREERAHASRAVEPAIGPDSATLATGGDDGFVRLWSVGSAGIRAERLNPSPRPADPTPGQVRTVCFSPDGRSLVWGGQFGTVRLADSALARPSRDFRGHRGTVRCVRFSPEGRRLAAAGDDSTIRVWDAATGRTIHELKGHVGVTYTLDFSPDGRLLASGGSDGTVRLWDAATGGNLAILRDTPPDYPQGLTVFAVKFTLDGEGLLVGGNTNELSDAPRRGYLGLWDLRHYDRHIAGNAGYWIDRLQEEGRPSPIAKEARRWAEGYRGAVEKK